MEFPEGRRELTRLDPLMFAVVYLPHHLRAPDGSMTLSEFHMDLIDYAKSWVKGVGEPMEHRDCFIAPRESGKSTWLFTLLPMWAAAHGYVKFIAAFSASATQAQGHLLTFKAELDTNEYLRSDFPDLCQPRLTKGTKRPIANNNWKIIQDNGFVFAASGVDVSNHGIKVGNQRPDLIILDDIEPGEKVYSAHQVRQTMSAVFDDIAPMNIRARMVFVGTTTMAGSLIDQMRKYREWQLASLRDTPSDWIETEGHKVPDDLAWVADQQIDVHYYPAIMANDDGSERSLWPEKWSLDWMHTQRHTRTFAKNYMNKPVSMDGQFWGDGDIKVDVADYGNTLISVDPAVTKNKLSDYTGIAVLSRGNDKRVYVRLATQVKMSPNQLAMYVRDLVERYNAGLLLVETNQGGDLWREVFKDIPCKFRARHQSASKNIRAGKALNYYQQDRVRHTDAFPILMEQMYAFPNVAHDDVLDAVVSGVLYFLDGEQAGSIKLLSTNYLVGA